MSYKLAISFQKPMLKVNYLIKKKILQILMSSCKQL